jgi:long-chain acyl-CoA synthetase
MKGFDDLGVTIINGYGITECSPIVALNRNNNIRYGTVGNPVPNMQVKIENPDENGEGEIWVKGDIVMMGYYKKPEETAKVMKDGWFNTGDIGKLENNFLSITGRKKNLIILGNGKNVYPEEIETLISFVENVTEVVVYQENEMIVAEVYTNAEENIEGVQAKIKADIMEVNKQLAAYKQVKKVKFRDTEFEKTTTKKIKRAKIHA